MYLGRKERKEIAGEERSRNKIRPEMKELNHLIAKANEIVKNTAKSD